MSRGAQQSVFVLRLPGLKKLIFVPLSLQGEHEEPRSKQIKTCRELVLLYSDILASPALDSFTDIIVVMAVSFFQKGILQVYAQRHHLQLGSPQCVLPGALQCCLSYSLITRLAPSWNKAGLFLISGKDFLAEKGRMNAVSMELSTSEGQLCISIEASTVRMPPTTLEDFDLSPLVLKRFNSDPDFIVDPSSTGAAIWCHVLPSMKKGQIITISRQLPRNGPFRTYRDLQNHWNRLYGYRLPEVTEEELVYCSVYFRLLGDRLFTYPLSCIRLQPVQRCPRVDLEGALGSFMSDIGARLQSVCGFPARLSSRACHHPVGLNAAATVQELSGEQVNLITSSSTRQVLTQLPAPPPRRTVKPFFGSQPPPWTPLSQQDQAQGLTQTQGRKGDKKLPSSSSSCVSYSSSYQAALSFSTSSPPLFQPASSLTSSISSSSCVPLFQPASSLTSSISSSSCAPLFRPASSLTSSISSSSVPLFQPASSLTSSISSSSSVPLFQPASSLTSSISSSSCAPLFQPASSLTSSISSSSSVPLFQPASSLTSSICSSGSVLSALPPLSQPPVNPAPKLVPIFKNKRPSCHINVALLRLQQSGGVENRGKVIIPTFGKNKATTAPLASSFSACLPIPPPPIIPRFKPQTQSSSAPRPSAQLENIFSLSPASKCKSGLILPSKPEIKLKPKSILKTRSDRNTDTNSSCKSSAASPDAPQLLPSSVVSNKDLSSSNRGGVVFEPKLKKSRAMMRHVDVENMARNKQLSKLNSATLLAWLKGRGVLVSAKCKKEELMLKVMACLAEA